MSMRNKKGVALLWAMITATVLIFIGTITANAIIKESRMTVDIERSNNAYGAASSGVELAKWCIDTGCSVIGKSFSGVIDSSSYVTTISQAYTVGTKTQYDIKSTGTNGEVSRTIEATYGSSPFIQLDLKSYAPAVKGDIREEDYNDSTFTGGIVKFPDNFSFQFDIWKNPGNLGPDLGYRDAKDGSVTIGLLSDEFSESKMLLHIINANTPGSEELELLVTGYKDGLERSDNNPIVSDRIKLSDLGVTDLTGEPGGYALRVNFHYVKDSYFEVTIIKKDWVTDQDCTYRLSADMTGVTFAPTKPYEEFTGFDYIGGQPGQTTWKSLVPGVYDGLVATMRQSEASSGMIWGFLDNFSYKKD